MSDQDHNDKNNNGDPSDSSGPNDDTALFRRHTDGAKPLESGNKMPAYRPKVAAKARFARADDRAVLRESLEFDVDEVETSSGESLRFNRPSVGRRTMRKLGRGNFTIQDEIDLHGLIVPDAKVALREFVMSNCRRGNSCVRVIHGKGLGSGESGPILKAKVNAWLRRWDEILAFVSARQVDGGTGALYVLLRTQ